VVDLGVVRVRASSLVSHPGLWSPHLPLIWLIIHGALFATDIIVLRQLRRAPSLGRYFKLFALYWLVLTLLALAAYGYVQDSRFFGGGFVVLGVLAQGICVHGASLLIGAGFFLRRSNKRMGVLSMGLGIVTFAVGGYAFWIEPYQLGVQHFRVESAKLEEPMRLVVISDLQLESVGEYERRALRLALDQDPDVLLFPGDFIHSMGGEVYENLKAELNTLMRREGLGARLGGIAVGGNVDHAGWPSMFGGLGVRCFEESGSIELDGVFFSAVGFCDSGDIKLKIPAHEGYHVAVGHRPDFALGDVQADLLVAGHTHGGQVALPFFGPPITLTQVPRAWASGRTQLDAGRTLIVSRGVGLERGYAPRLRFLCPPQIVIIDLTPLPEKP